MPDVNSIPFRQAAGNGHYESKQLPNDNADFLAILGLPVSVGNVTSASPSSLDGQLAAYWGTSGLVIKASAQIGIVDLVDGKVTTKATPAGEIVGTVAVQTLSNKSFVNCTVTDPVGLDKNDVGLGNVDNTADSAKPVSAPQQLALDLKEDKNKKGVANGYASLDAGGKVPDSQLSAAIAGSLNYKGGWNAATNAPPIPVASAGNRGWYYVVGVAGTTNIDGISSWAVNDWVVSNGTAWNKVDNTDLVTSVAGQTGDVVVTKSDVGLANVDNTSDAAKNAAVATLTNKTIHGAANVLTVRLDTTDVAGNLPPTRLDGGVNATSNTFWRGDSRWATPAGAGDVIGPAGAGDGQFALYDGTTGKLLKATSTIPAASVTWRAVVADTVQGSNPPNAVIVPSFIGHPDRVIASPTAFDDHFDGTSLGVKWTVTGDSVSYSVAGSCLNSISMSNSAADGVQRYAQFEQPLVNANDFTLSLKLDGIISCANNAASVGVVQIGVQSKTPSVQGLMIRITKTWIPAATGAQEAMGFRRALNLATSDTSNFFGDNPRYIRFVWRRTALTMAIHISPNGAAWLPLTRDYSSAETGLTAGILPSHFNITTAGTNLGRAAISLDWITFVND